MYLNNLFSRLALHVPFRMLIGKFGIWLSKVGRLLQKRYANWNSEFRLKSVPNGSDTFEIHISERVTTKEALSFYGSGSQIELQTPLVKALFMVKGVTKVILFPYTVRVYKAEVYAWEELLPRIERLILRHVVSEGSGLDAADARYGAHNNSYQERIEELESGIIGFSNDLADSISPLINRQKTVTRLQNILAPKKS